jgi:hypothetical protein
LDRRIDAALTLVYFGGEEQRQVGSMLLANAAASSEAMGKRIVERRNVFNKSGSRTRRELDEAEVALAPDSDQKKLREAYRLP